MAETTVKQSYHYNMPREKHILGQTIWTGAAPTTVTLQPVSPTADFVAYLKLRITDNFAMTATDVITLTIKAYGVTQTLTVTSAGVAATDLAALISWGDAELYRYMTVAAAVQHAVVLKFKPPIYLRSSTTPAESIVLAYTPTGGGITAGSIIVSYEGWQLSDEDDSGIY
jgi:hypothetical protein